MSRNLISHYTILKKLGAGGMGEVYLAEDSKLNRKVAIKLLLAESAADDNARRRLLREARAAASLDHPNICTIHEVGEDDGRGFIVMQYIEGETLAARIARQPLDVNEALDAAIQTADALAAAHSLGIIHRDIKPQNIMLTGRGRIKMLDFGLAKVVAERGVLHSEVETQSLLTESGMIIGTLPYMSPEQVKGESLDARSDIFSFGALLYEMLSGHQPFAARTGAETISAILMSNPPSLSSHSDRVPAGLDQIVRRCLEKNCEQRYQAAAAVAADLESVRRNCESGSAIAPVSGMRTAATKALSTNPNATGESLSTDGRLTSRSRQVLIAVVVLTAITAAFVLLFRGSGITPQPSGKSVGSPAYEDYMRGHVIVNSENREDNETAIKLLQQAVKADPDFAPAWADLGRAYNTKAFYLAPDAEKKQLNLDAEVAVERSLTLDPNLAEGHYARGLTLWSHANRFPHVQAIQSYQKAIALNPNLDEAHHQLGTVYLHIGLLDKSWAEVERALEIKPSNKMARFRQGVVRLYQGRYEEALAIFNGVPREVNPALWGRTTVTALFQLGRVNDASSLVKELLRDYPDDEGGNVTSVKAMLLARAGKAQEAEDIIQQAIKIGKGFGHFHHTAYNIALAYSLLKQPEKAVKWLEAAADDGFPCYPLFQNDANLNNVRNDERFIALMASLKKQWEQYQATF